MDLNLIIGFLYLFATLVGVLLINKNLDLSFWLIINMYFDPGGYLTVVSERFLNRLDFQDILIIVVFFMILRIKGVSTIIYQNPLFNKFIKFFLFFTFFYFIVYGGIIPYLKDDFNYTVFLLKSRRFIYGIIILIAVYIFTLRGAKYLFLTTLFVALPTILLFWLSILTSIPFMEVFSLERYKGSGIVRLGILSYGIVDILFPLSAIVYFFSQQHKINIKYKRIFYVLGVFILASLLISLTRRTIIDVLGTIIIVGYLTSKITKTSTVLIPLRFIIPVFVLILTLSIFKPTYINYITTVTSDTALVLITGKDTRGVTEARVSGGGLYPEVYKEIKENITFGTGYTYFQWEFIKTRGSILANSTRGLHFGQLADAAQEIPILNIFFSFGIIGFLLLLPLYLSLFKLAKRLYSLLIINYKFLIENDRFTLVFSIFFVLLIAKLFTYNIWTLGDQFIGRKFQINAVWFGLGFALLQKNKNILEIIRTKYD